MKILRNTLIAGLLFLAVTGLGSCTLLNCLDPLMGTWRMDTWQEKVDCTFYPNQVFNMTPARGIRTGGVWTRSGSHIKVMFDNGEVRTWRYAIAADGRTMTILTEGAEAEVTLYRA